MATYMDGMDGGKHNSDNTESTPKKKKKYSIQQSAPAFQYWYYEVEADSEDEALELVLNGEVDPIDYDVETASGEDEFEVTDEEDIV
jgi:hypothetical protein